MTSREGSLEAPTRHPIEWKSEAYWNEAQLDKELERVFDICHGCRRCVSLCGSFPTLFDLVDESSTMEVDGVAKADLIIEAIFENLEAKQSLYTSLEARMKPDARGVRHLKSQISDLKFRNLPCHG